MKVKVINICFLLVLFLSLTGCGDKYHTEYDVGVIYTTEYKDKTKIEFLNEKFENVNSMVYGYSNMSYDGFSNAQILEDTLYLLPKGRTNKLDYGKVIAYNLNDGKIKEFDFGRTNITDFSCTSDYICASSNLNGKNYIDVYNKQNDKIQTIELEDVMVTCLVMIEERMFGIMNKFENDDYFLCEFDVEKESYEILYEMDEETGFVEKYGRSLYFCGKDILYEYDIERKTINKTKLSDTNAYNLNIVGDILYIGYTDIFNGTKSYVDIMRLQDKEIIKSLGYDGIILQMEISEENKLYILDYDKLNVYDISKEEAILLESMDLPTNNSYYIGGFYLNEKNRKGN